MEPYRSVAPDACRLLPRTEEVCREVLVLPTGPSVTGRHVARICAVIRSALAHAALVRQRLAS
jgi:dTDP-4-amino-4,6-dideoxygalactose transaminase